MGLGVSYQEGRQQPTKGEHKATRRHPQSIQNVDQVFYHSGLQKCYLSHVYTVTVQPFFCYSRTVRPVHSSHSHKLTKYVSVSRGIHALEFNNIRTVIQPLHTHTQRFGMLKNLEGVRPVYPALSAMCVRQSGIDHNRAFFKYVPI